VSGTEGQHQIGWLGYQQRARIESSPLRISAALWRLDQDAPIEFVSTNLPDGYLVCAHIEGSIDWDCKTPTRHYHRAGVAQTFCMAFPGEQANVVLQNAHSSFVHFHIPGDLVRLQLDDLAPSTQPTALEILDPMNKCDLVVDEFARRAAQLMVQKTPVSRLLVESLGLQLAAHLLEKHSNLVLKSRRRSTGGLSAWQIRRVCDFMEANLAQDISLAELGALLDLSPNHLCTAFRQSVGMPPHAWLLDSRMKRAKTMLANPCFSLTDIALAVGYADQSAFGAAYRRANGISPGQWRNKLSS
jgi:AraC family transcriptional regulator